MALANGFPVRRLHTTVVSRWFVIPLIIGLLELDQDPGRTYHLDAAPWATDTRVALNS